MNRLSKPFVVLLAGFIVGCAAFGLQADTFNKRVAAYEVSAIGVVATVDSLVELERISPDDGENAVDLAVNAQKGLKVARKIHAVDAEGGEAKLEAVRIGLDALLEYLDEKEREAQP